MTGHPSALWLIRHGETQWTVLRRHTGRTDLALTPRGEKQAKALGRKLTNCEFELTLTSPLARAVETCRLAGQGAIAQVDHDLKEWDYGEFEGRTTADIREDHPNWNLWRDGAPRGELPEEVAERADRVIGRALGVAGHTALFAHGHVLRMVAARWLGLPPHGGAWLALDTASMSVLAMEREQRVIQHWNEVCHLEVGE